MRRRGKTLGAIDLHVASRLRERRVVLGISQLNLAAALSLSFQQVHKYEQGKSRISAGRLYDFSKVLGVPITFFFEGAADALMPVTPLPTGDHPDELGRREAIELFAAYRAIPSPALRGAVRQLARALAPKPIASAPKAAVSQSRKPSRRVRTDRGRGATKR